MKKNRYTKFSLLIVALAMLFAACESIVDEKELENTTDVAGVELVATQSTNGGNEITLSMVTPGITGYWDYNLGRAFTDKVTIIYPIPGTSTFTFTGTLGAEFFEKTIDVTVEQLDHALDQDWYDLVGTETAAGKSWKFAGTGGDGGLWWFMSDPGNKPWSVWWNAGGECCPPGDVNGKMHFDLNGAANYTYYADAAGEGQLGSFVLDVANQTLQLNDQIVLGGVDGGGNGSGLFQIVELTEEKMVLYVPNAAWATGWTYVYVPVE